MTAPWRRDFDTARDPYAARNALGITSTGGGGGGAPTTGQQVATAYGENTTFSTAVNPTMAGGFDTVPQITDGVEIVTATITPNAVGNKLRFTITVPWGANTNPNVWIALFQGSTAAAIAAMGTSCFGAGYLTLTTWEFEMAATATSATTFRVRFGIFNGATATLYINGTSAVRYLGGAQRVNLGIEETAI